MYMYMHIPVAIVNIHVCPIAHNKHVHKQSLHTTHVHVHVLLDYIVPVIELCSVLVLVISNCILQVILTVIDPTLRDREINRGIYQINYCI